MGRSDVRASSSGSGDGVVVGGGGDDVIGDSPGWNSGSGTAAGGKRLSLENSGGFTQPLRTSWDKCL